MHTMAMPVPCHSMPCHGMAMARVRACVRQEPAAGARRGAAGSRGGGWRRRLGHRGPRRRQLAAPGDAGGHGGARARGGPQLARRSRLSGTLSTARTAAADRA
jgi:hypothetical protein